MSEDQFYFKGQYFKTAEKMFSYANKWGRLPMDQESLEEALHIFSKDVCMNIIMRDIKLTNLEMQAILDEIFYHTLTRFSGGNDEQVDI